MSVDFAGDLDGDGMDELLIGAPYYDGSGSAWVLPGRSDAEGPISLAAQGIGLLGAAQGDAAGFAVAGAGDVDGDGLDDVLVGAWGEDSIGTDAGRAWLVHGPITVGGSLDRLGTVFEAEYSYDNLGFAVASAGDLDRDGRADLLIGAPFHDDGGSRSGTVFVTTETDAARLIGGRPGDELGHSISSAGDFNGDGSDDVIVGAWNALHGKTRAGAAYIWLGPLSGALEASTADHVLLGEESGDRAGAAVTGIGDHDGDGLADVAVGSMVGTVWLLSGRQDAAQRLTADRIVDGLPAARVGASLAAAGDLNTDGKDDLLIGAPSWDEPVSNSGGFAVLYGGDADIERLPRTWWSLAGEGTMAGISLAGGGDVDGDGMPDVLVGGQGGGLDREGVAWLLPGSAW